MKNYTSILRLTIYKNSPRNATVYCDYWYYNNITREFQNGRTKAGGYGYDKWCTACSNALNIFKEKFTRYKKGKYKTSYGLDNDNSIDYGIGLNAVIDCIRCFKNVKINKIYYGKYEDCIELYINEEKEY